ncbi:hypothetical protein PCANB_001809 [Pneumocystis canis]|nr:hypothetical protein PCK1_002029 [Pneumocystis canis]KAG5440239.1 hypothetical protein PCANB_001809 [Pneumocystis canis]
MPNVSILTSEDKQTIKKHIPKPTNRIITAAIARLYVAHPNPNKWRFTGISGAVVFVYDMVGNTLFLKIVDISNSNRGIIWDQELYEDFRYHQDRTFFHSFELEKCMAGLSFADVNEASIFYRRVNERLCIVSHKNLSVSGGSGATGSLKTSVKKRTIDKSKIGAPSHFQHVSHIGWDSEKGFTIENIDPSWKKLFDELGQFGFSYKQIEENKELIQDYVVKNGGLENITQMSETSTKSSINPPSQQEFIKRPHLKEPPPPAPLPSVSISNVSNSPFLKRAPPPPPPPRKSYIAASETGQSSSSIHTQYNPPPPKSSIINQHESSKISSTNPNASIESIDSTNIKPSTTLETNKQPLQRNPSRESRPSHVSQSKFPTHTVNPTLKHSISSISSKPSTSSTNKNQHTYTNDTEKSPFSKRVVSQLQLPNKTSTSDVPPGSSFPSHPPSPPPPPPPPPFPGSQTLTSTSPKSSKKNTTSVFSQSSNDKAASTTISNISDASPELLNSVDHSNLMASIRSSGGISMLKKVHPASTPRTSSGYHNETIRTASGSGGFTNLEDALVAVLNNRKGKVALSDEEESDNDDWDD